MLSSKQSSDILILQNIGQEWHVLPSHQSKHHLTSLFFFFFHLTCILLVTKCQITKMNGSDSCIINDVWLVLIEHRSWICLVRLLLLAQSPHKRNIKETCGAKWNLPLIWISTFQVTCRAKSKRSGNKHPASLQLELKKREIKRRWRDLEIWGQWFQSSNR